MGGFPDIQTQLGQYVDSLVSFIDTTFKGLFDFIFLISSRTINGIDDFLVWLPWWLCIIIVIMLGWYFKSVFSGFLCGFFIFLIGTFGLVVDLMYSSCIILTS